MKGTGILCDNWNKGMEATQNLYLLFGLLTITDEPPEPGMWNFV